MPTPITSEKGFLSFLISKEPRVEILNITPELARLMLQKNTRNRSLKAERVKAIADSIKAGRYVFTNASIGFDKDGVLVDGQHRLEAIIQAGIPVKSVVVLGCNQSPYLDRGTKRSITDNLTITNSKEYKSLVIAAINQLYRVYTGCHQSMDDVKVGICYDLIREDLEEDGVAKIFRRDRKNINYSADYMAAIILLLLSKKFKTEDIVTMHTLFAQGYVEGDDHPNGSRFVLELRNDYVMGHKPFGKMPHGNNVDMNIERTMVFLQTMLAYQMNTFRRKKPSEVKSFIETYLKPVFDLIDEEYIIRESAAG